MKRKVMLLLLLPLSMSAACSSLSTASRLTLAEQPKMSTVPAELAKAEKPADIVPAPTGELVTVDKGLLTQLTAAHAEALGMVARGNERIAGWISWAYCQRKILSTGKAPNSC